MKTLKPNCRRALIAVVVIGSALTFAAWAPVSKTRASSRNEGVPAFKRCMRAHGVPLNSGQGIDPYSPSFKAARVACTKLLPGFARAKAQMLKVSKCMRQHGISRFPDPTLSLPSNPARAVARSGLILAVPSSINVRSRAFKHAAAVCKFPPKGSYPLRGAGPFAAAGHGYSS